jgi:phospholipase C
LPNYSFIEPRYYSDIRLFPPQINLPNDMHPPHVVCFGDQLIATVYNALRGNAEAWKKTARRPLQTPTRRTRYGS